MVRRSIWVGLTVLCLVCGFKTSTTLAQAVYGSILGTVTDPQGAAVSGAKVTVISVTKSTAVETTTNESGNYSVTHLIPDTYKIRIEAAGFKSTDIPIVQVSADSAAHVDATMQVGAVTQSVEVTGEIPQLKTDRADVDVEFSQKYVEDLRLPRILRVAGKSSSMASISAAPILSWMGPITRTRSLALLW